MPNLFKGVVKLTEDQYKTLLRGGSFDFNGQTIVYDANTLYVTDYSIDGELDVNSLNPVTNRAIALALNDKAGKEEIPANVVTTNTEQDIEGNKNFVGNVTKNGVNLATVEDIKVTDTLDHQYDDYALSVKGGMVLNDKITTLIENVNGRVQSFSLNSLNDLLTLFNITTNTDEAMEQYPVSTKNITYMDKEYTLKTGDIFLIVDTDVPDYWFSADTMMLYKMETMKVDLTNYATIDFVTNSVKNKAEQSSLNATNQNVASNTSEIATLKANQKTKLSEMVSDAEHRTVTDSQINMWDNKIDEVDLEGYATEEYVNQNGGKIDKIYLNDVEQEIVNKEVHLEVEIPEIEQITDYYKVGNKLTGIDLNTIVVPGNYGVANDCTNMPIKENGTLFVGEYDKGTYVQQLFIGTNNKVYTRNSTSVDNSTWSEWLMLARSSDLNNYLAKSGGTMTGNIVLSNLKGLVSSDGTNVIYTEGPNGNIYIGSLDKGLGLRSKDAKPFFIDKDNKITSLALMTDIPDVSGLAKASDLSNYLPLSGGTMKGPLVITGGDAASGAGNIQLSPDGQIVYQNSSTTLFGMSGSQLIVGTPVYNSIFRGKQQRPVYNGSDLALYSDIAGFATETYVNNAIKDLIGSAPDTLNTLEELATAIGNNKDIVDGLGDTYVPLSGSKAMTGKLNAPKGITVGAQASGGSGDNEIGIDFGTYSKLSARDGLIGVYANGDIALRPYYDSNTSNGVKITETTLYPTRNATMDLGTSTYKFKNIYASGTINSAKVNVNQGDATGGIILKRTDSTQGGAFIDYYSNNQGTTYSRTGNFSDNSFGVAFQGSLDTSIRIKTDRTILKDNTYTYTLPNKTGTVALTSDLSEYAKLSGGNTFTGVQHIKGTAGSKPFWVRGIQGCLEDGVTENELHLNYQSNHPVKWGYDANGQLNSDGTITEAGTLLSNKYVTLATSQTISGTKTFNAPTNSANTEQATVKFKTANGGAIILGKEGPNSGTMIRLDQADGTTRLQFRASNTAGAMVWKQPESGAALYFDFGPDAKRVTMPTSGGTLALTSQIPDVSSYLPKSGGTMTGDINMNNKNITGVNNLQIVDTGAGEGIEWVGGNGWKIYESDNALGNNAGNLQFVTGSTRRMTIETSGALNVTERITSSLSTSTHISGNQGKAIINSTAGAGYNMLFRMKSSNGVFTGGAYNADFNIYYTADSTISAGTNSITKATKLMNESGDASFGNNVSVAGYVNASSDKRLKENIIDVDENSLKSFIENTPIKAFNYKSNGNRTVGVIAQDIENLEINGAKFTNVDEDGFLQVHETKFVYLLWNYCQQLNKRIKELESKVK